VRRVGGARAALLWAARLGGAARVSGTAGVAGAATAGVDGAAGVGGVGDGGRPTARPSRAASVEIERERERENRGGDVVLNIQLSAAVSGGPPKITLFLAAVSGGH
jgi:hypothetical protein